MIYTLDIIFHRCGTNFACGYGGLLVLLFSYSWPFILIGIFFFVERVVMDSKHRKKEKRNLGLRPSVHLNLFKDVSK